MPRFSDKLVDYFQAPVNRGRLEPADCVGSADLHGVPPRVWFYLKLAGHRVAQASFEAAGCGVTIACASVLSEIVTGKDIGACRFLSAEDISDALDGIPKDKMYCASVVAAALHAALPPKVNEPADADAEAD